MTPDDIVRLSAPVPRYTSYPTAPHFHAGVDVALYRAWLSALPERASLSLYMHVPFCDTLCWFCGCHTKITQKYAPVQGYLGALAKEIAAVGAAVPQGAQVRHIHWGGGSPTMLEAKDILRLAQATREGFQLAPDCEFAVEIDPRGMDQARIDALIEAGLTRVSIGVQDFDPAVQKAINRIQSVEETERVIEAFRSHGVRSLNIDAIYGLPGQTEAKLMRTLDEVVRLKPDRVALFGYAHVPWMKRHQAMIDENALPDVPERYRQAENAAAHLVAAGYVRIGIDHFALPHDELALAMREGRVQRNFQGYTVDPADALIGLGASSIGRLPQGYVQNVAAIAEYQRQANREGLAVAKGIELSREDAARAHVIERLMCDLSFSRQDLTSRYGAAAAPILLDAARVAESDRDGFIVATADGFRVSEQGRPFLRSIAAQFDTYLAQRQARHSVAV